MINIHYLPINQLVSLTHPLASRAEYQQQQKTQLHAYRQRILQQICPELEIVSSPYGKPMAKNAMNLCFNHSHSQAYYALAYSTTVQDVGVDIEDLNRSVKMQALAKRSFHPDEYQCWQQLDYCREYWFKVWTIKEAVLKAHGLGIRLDLKSINTQAHPTWCFGRVVHPSLGCFDYQNFLMSNSMLTVAYRALEMQIVPVHFIR